VLLAAITRGHGLGPTIEAATPAPMADPASPPGQPAAGLLATSAAGSFELCADPEIPAEVVATFQLAGVLWSRYLVTTVPVVVELRWRQLGPKVLAHALPSHLVLGEPGLPRADLLYPVALANQLAGRDLTPGPCLAGSPPPGSPETADLVIEVNSGVGAWHTELHHHVPPDRLELLSVALHEMAHGLGLASSADGAGPLGRIGRRYGGEVIPNVYDRHLVRASDSLRLTALDDPRELAAALRSGDVHFDGRAARAVHGGSVPLHAPEQWDRGSSISHLDPHVFDGTEHMLLRPGARFGVAARPSRLVVAMLDDLGWTTRWPDP
jgi:hypothetical protein